MQKSISVIIPAHGRTQFTSICIKYFRDAIRHFESKSKITVQLIIVEHSEFSEHKNNCQSWMHYLHIPLLDGKFNKSLCHNEGVKYSPHADYYLFHDIDTIVPKDFFVRLMINIQGYDAVQSFTKQRLNYCNEKLTEDLLSGIETIENLHHERSDIFTEKQGRAQGGSMFVSRKILFDVGGFDTTYTEYSIEDAQFFDKLKTVGKLGFCDNPPIELYHLYHEPSSWGRVTKDEDFNHFNNYVSLRHEQKLHFIKNQREYLNLIKDYKMERPKIKLADVQFSHSGQGSFGAGDLKIEPKNFEWYRGGERVGDIVIITENAAIYADAYSGGISNAFSEPIKILLILESPLINPDIYKTISNPKHYNNFDYILTFSKELVKLNPSKFIWYAFGGCWILEGDRNIYAKKHNISIIASEKRITEGHRLRHEAIDKFKNKIHGIYGRGYKRVENKIDALMYYNYSIVIENDCCNDMFSEKIIDCFVTGTIPIYLGCPSIGEYFDINGIICFDNIDELELALDLATPEYYQSKIEAVQSNFLKALDYVLPEDYIWKTFLKEIYEKN